MSDDPPEWSSDDADIPESVPYPRAAIAAVIFAVVAVVAVIGLVLYAAFVADRSGPATAHPAVLPHWLVGASAAVVGSLVA